MQIKFIPTILLLLFTISPHLSAHPTIQQIEQCADNYDFSLVESFQANDKSPCIIYIEDAHCNYLAQHEIARILRTLYQNELYDIVTVEGSQGPINTDLCATFPIDTVRKNIAEQLLKNGIISGEEYLCIYDGISMPLYGVDDQTLYQSNISYFRTYVGLQNEIEPILSQIHDVLEQSKQAIYNRDLASFDTAVELYNAGEGDVTTIVSYIKPEQIAGYPVVSQACEIINRQNTISDSILDAQCKSMILRLLDSDDIDVSDKSQDLYARFINNTIKFKDYCMAITDLAKQNALDINQYDMIQQYLWCTDQAVELNAKQFDKELQQLIADCYRNLCINDKEKELYRLATDWRKLERLVQLQLDRTEYTGFQQIDTIAQLHTITDFIAQYGNTSFLTTESITILNRAIHNNLDFYRIASKRDEVLSSNTLAFMNNKNADTAVLISGGFHTKSVTQYCKENEISYAILRPTKIADYDFDQYSSVLLRSERTNYFTDQPRTSEENYLRATSFFAQHSFDDARRVSEFRSEVVFNALIEAMDKVYYKDLFSIVRQWRSAYVHAIALRHETDSPEYHNALSLFDYMITDMFAYNKIMVDNNASKLFITHNGSITTLSRAEDGTAIISTNPELDFQSRMETSMRLKEAPLNLTNAEVFIASWTLADKQSPHYRHGDAHFSIKYIEALNKRGIAPIVILPDDENEHAETLRKYEPAISNDQYEFTFAVFDSMSETYIRLDKNMVPFEEIELPVSKRAVIIYLDSQIDSEHDARLNAINDRFTSLFTTNSPPVYIRIPTAGTTPSQMQNMETIDLFMNPVARELLPDQAIQSGFMLDGELLAIVKQFKKHGTSYIRKSMIDSINESISANQLIESLDQLGETIESISDQHWTFRYLTEKNDSELAAFIHSAQQYAAKQVIFTFYKDTPEDNRYISFLKSQTSFIDLTRANNNIIDPSKSILIVNLPPVESVMFKTLLAASDSAVVSGENSLTEGLVLNKLGIGPTILFKPAIPEHLSILTNLLHNTDKDFMLAPLQNYAQLEDTDGKDYFESYDPRQPLADVSQSVYDVLYDPYISTIMRGAMSDAVYESNGLNTLTDVIDDINKQEQTDTIIGNHNISPQVFAQGVMDDFFYDESIDIQSIDNMKQFATEHIREFIRIYANTMMLNDISLDLINRRITEFARSLLQLYKTTTTELGIASREELSSQFQSVIQDSINSIYILDGGHLFMPVVIDGSLYYRYDHANLRVFAPELDNPDPRIETQYLTPKTANRMMTDLQDAYYIKKMVDAVYSNVDPFSHYDNELLPPTYNSTNPMHGNILKGYIGLATLDYFRNLIQKNATFLEHHFGIANTRTLNEYIRTISTRGNITENTALINGYLSFTTAIVSEPKTGTTNFFRDVENWQTEYEDYLNDIILQKVARGDYTLSIRSVGSALGKEAYSIGSFLEQALLQYARDNVYHNITNISERNALVEQWVDKWDIKLFAFDNSILRLTTAKEGTYDLDDQALSFLAGHTNHEKLFSEEYFGHDEFPIVRVNNRLRGWLVPVFVDLDKNPEVLSRYPAEITFAMNMINYLRYASIFLTELTTSTNPNYKAFVSYNISFDDPPIVHGLVKGQDLVIPPKTVPSADTIDRIITGAHVTSTKNLSDLLGLNDEQLEQIVGKPVDAKTTSNFDRVIRNRQNRYLIDSML